FVLILYITLLIVSLMFRCIPTFTLFPYTTLFRSELLRNLDTLHEDDHVMLKLTIPTVANTYKETTDHLNVLRVVALSGGYSRDEDRKSTRLNSSHVSISYAVFCLK